MVLVILVLLVRLAMNKQVQLAVIVPVIQIPQVMVAICIAIMVAIRIAIWALVAAVELVVAQVVAEILVTVPVVPVAQAVVDALAVVDVLRVLVHAMVSVKITAQEVAVEHVMDAKHVHLHANLVVGRDVLAIV